MRLRVAWLGSFQSARLTASRPIGSPRTFRSSTSNRSSMRLSSSGPRGVCTPSGSKRSRKSWKHRSASPSPKAAVPCVAKRSVGAVGGSCRWARMGPRKLDGRHEHFRRLENRVQRSCRNGLPQSQDSEKNLGARSTCPQRRSQLNSRHPHRVPSGAARLRGSSYRARHCTPRFASSPRLTARACADPLARKAQVAVRRLPATHEVAPDRSASYYLARRSRAK